MYRQPREKPPPAPYALIVGFDWQRFHLPPTAGGMDDQPLQLLKEIRFTLNVYEAIQAWRNAQHNLSSEGFSKFCSANPDLVKFMTEEVLFLESN